MWNKEMLIAHYLSYCKYEKGWDGKMQEAYNIDLLQFTAYISGKGDDLSNDNLQAYLTELHKRYKIKGAKRKLAILSTFFNYLEYEDILPDNPLNRMRMDAPSSAEGEHHGAGVRTRRLYQRI